MADEDADQVPEVRAVRERESGVPGRVQFTVPGKPPVKERPRIGRNGRTYTPQATQSAEQMIGWCFRHKAKGWRPVDQPVGLEVVAYMPNRRRRDGDNVLKITMDALNGLAYRDDSQVLDGRFRVEFDPENPRTEVAVWVL